MEKIKNDIIDKADSIADALERGKDVEIRKGKDGITLLEIDKRLIRRGNNGWDDVSK